MIKIEPALTKEDCIGIQTVFNHKDVIGYLGGFCILDNLVNHVRQSGVTIWKATVDSQIVGGFITAGRKQCHMAKFGEVAVLPEYRRRRIATALYAACIFQCILEGRRLISDTIVGDNEAQQMALPALGIQKVGILPIQTASFKDIIQYVWLLSQDALAHVFNRLPDDCSIRIVDDYYTKDLWTKNEIIYLKKKPEFIDVVKNCLAMLYKNSKIIIEKGADAPEHNRGKKQDNSFI